MYVAMLLCYAMPCILLCPRAHEAVGINANANANAPLSHPFGIYTTLHYTTVQ